MGSATARKCYTDCLRGSHPGQASPLSGDRPVQHSDSLIRSPLLRGIARVSDYVVVKQGVSGGLKARQNAPRQVRAFWVGESK